MIAIIIPYFKLTFFEATLQSLANQTDKRFKVYIGDDASPDDCALVLNQFIGQFDLTYHRFETNIGGASLTQQWERCIALINDEDWLMILGDDDVLGENVVASFYRNLEEINRNGSQVIRFASRYIDEFQKPLKGYPDYFNPKLEKSEDSFYRNLLGQSRSSLSEYTFSKTSFRKFGFYNYPLAWHSDDRAWLEFTDGNEIYSINEAIVEVRVTQESITGKKDNEIVKQKTRAQFYEFILSENQFNFTRKQNINILLYYGILIQNQKPLSITKVSFIFISLIKLLSFYNALRFVRRIIRSQFRYIK